MLNIIEANDQENYSKMDLIGILLSFGVDSHSGGKILSLHDENQLQRIHSIIKLSLLGDLAKTLKTKRNAIKYAENKDQSLKAEEIFLILGKERIFEIANNIFEKIKFLPENAYRAVLDYGLDRKELLSKDYRDDEIIESKQTLDDAGSDYDASDIDDFDTIAERLSNHSNHLWNIESYIYIDLMLESRNKDVDAYRQIFSKIKGLTSEEIWNKTYGEYFGLDTHMYRSLASNASTDLRNTLYIFKYLRMQTNALESVSRKEMARQIIKNIEDFSADEIKALVDYNLTREQVLSLNINRTVNIYNSSRERSEITERPKVVFAYLDEVIYRTERNIKKKIDKEKYNEAIFTGRNNLNAKIHEAISEAVLKIDGLSNRIIYLAYRYQFISRDNLLLLNEIDINTKDSEDPLDTYQIMKAIERNCGGNSWNKDVKTHKSAIEAVMAEIQGLTDAPTINAVLSGDYSEEELLHIKKIRFFNRERFEFLQKHYHLSLENLSGHCLDHETWLLTCDYLRNRFNNQEIASEGQQRKPDALRFFSNIKGLNHFGIKLMDKYNLSIQESRIIMGFFKGDSNDSELFYQIIAYLDCEIQLARKTTQNISEIKDNNKNEQDIKVAATALRKIEGLGLSGIMMVYSYEVDRLKSKILFSPLPYDLAQELTPFLNIKDLVALRLTATGHPERDEREEREMSDVKASTVQNSSEPEQKTLDVKEAATNTCFSSELVIGPEVKELDVECKSPRDDMDYMDLVASQIEIGLDNPTDTQLLHKPKELSLEEKKNESVWRNRVLLQPQRPALVNINLLSISEPKVLISRVKPSELLLDSSDFYLLTLTERNHKAAYAVYDQEFLYTQSENKEDEGFRSIGSNHRR